MWLCLIMVRVRPRGVRGRVRGTERTRGSLLMTSHSICRVRVWVWVWVRG